MANYLLPTRPSECLLTYGSGAPAPVSRPRATARRFLDALLSANWSVGWPSELWLWTSGADPPDAGLSAPAPRPGLPAYRPSGARPPPADFSADYHLPTRQMGRPLTSGLSDPAPRLRPSGPGLPSLDLRPRATPRRFFGVFHCDSTVVALPGSRSRHSGSSHPAPAARPSGPALVDPPLQPRARPSARRFYGELPPADPAAGAPSDLRHQPAGFGPPPADFFRVASHQLD